MLRVPALAGIVTGDYEASSNLVAKGALPTVPPDAKASVKVLPTRDLDGGGTTTSGKAAGPHVR